MKKLTFLILASIACFSDELIEEKESNAKSYNYTALEFPVVNVPGIVIGKKIELDKEHSGDYSLGFHIVPSHLQIFSSIKNDWYYSKVAYIGFGVFSSYFKSYEFNKECFSISPVVCHGWEHGSLAFSEINLYWPTISTVGNAYTPSFTYKLGFKF